jgi:hypothetical protein
MAKHETEMRERKRPVNSGPLQDFRFGSEATFTWLAYMHNLNLARGSEDISLTSSALSNILAKYL